MSDSPTPLFYKNLTPLDSKAHTKLKFPKTLKNFKFAAKANLIPIFIGEMADAARHYPLVFIPMPESHAPALVAVVGLGDDKNLMLDENGQWRANAYIPAYVRRYPFISLKRDDSLDSPMTLGFDQSAEGIGQEDGEVLFDNTGNPNERLNLIIKYETEFQLNSEATRLVSKMLLDADLFQESSLRLKSNTDNEEERVIGGFLMIDEQKLRDLPDDKLIELYRNNAIVLAHTHLLSLGNLERVLPNKLQAD
jgi:SapC